MATKFTILAKSLNGAESNIHCSGEPDECPICHNKILPKIHDYFYENNQIQGLYQCPNSKCAKLFIGIFYYDSLTTYQTLRYCYPKLPENIDFGEIIREISPSFEIIYNQAITAEATNLHEISGVGLRKALEFLVKDFAIHQKPLEAEKIKNMYLANCIKSYINDVNLKACAERAAWLGNDETHYLRMWEDKDIEDLKRLIKLSINWIENVILTEKYTAEMKPLSK